MKYMIGARNITTSSEIIKRLIANPTTIPRAVRRALITRSIFNVLTFFKASNEQAKLRAERARFLAASNRKSVNAKEP